MKTEKIKRALSLLVIGSMMFGAVACSKPSAKNLEKVAESKLDAEEYTLEEFKDMKDKEMQKAIKDGIVIKTSGEEIDDLYGKSIKNADTSSIGTYLKMINVDIDDWSTDDLGDISIYIKADGTDEISDGNFSDAIVLGAVVIEFTDKDKADEAFEDAMGEIEDMLEKYLDVDLDKLNEDEYLNDGNKGHLVINLDAEDMFDSLLDIFSEQMGSEPSSDDIKEAKKMIEGVSIVGGIYYEKGTFTIVFGLSGSGLDDMKTLAKGIGISNPLDVENSDELSDIITNAIGSGIGGYISRARSAAEEVERHNEAIYDVVSEIDSVT